MSVLMGAPSAPGLNIPNADQLAATGLVESPGTPSSPNAWARFEFEMGRGNEGSKVLVVEWDPAVAGADDTEPHQPRQDLDTWDVSWEGKIFKETNEVKEVEGDSTHRILILIEDDVHVPSVVTISHTLTGRRLVARPMPAIFTPALGADVTKAAGKRGVLHTQWAEKRLRQLSTEYDREVQVNSEGVGAQMAWDDMTWVAYHFGLQHPYPAGRPVQQEAPPTPQSPRSPVGGKLGEKLRGLKLATSPSELANTGGQRPNQHYFTPSNSGTTTRTRSALSTAVAVGGTTSGVASLDAMMEDDKSAPPARPPLENQVTEDELFALPMSPRSPEMKKSPFSMIK
ncbi:hypothetical protein BKA67DRAFT_44733 [Truncatella angustata]|uniref:Uncharacterized protein n=1 Tax=Truncatella angustata TaxID=152316 RepID=A0A9P9A4U3_9PEZI|nr:uncharacterized protein BKA67DRAFT_44733 [Truncatella angustata]KAH6660229.1 hypothetical protein BKA67DRAFT_44733 [Truncatella angustata]KAH8195232.1 hypothetical protein TruAng_010595 [Truncatella angustata]